MAKRIVGKTKVILGALDSHGDEGCGIISLSIETGVNQDLLRSFLQKHKAYCVPIDGKAKYKLNRLTEEHGSVAKIIAKIEKAETESKVSSRVGNAFLMGLFVGLGIPFLTEWLSSLYQWFIQL